MLSVGSGLFVSLSDVVVLLSFCCGWGGVCLLCLLIWKVFVLSMMI